MANSEPWYIQNPDIFRTLVYSECSRIQNSEAFFENSLHTLWNKYQELFSYSCNFTPILFILCIKSMDAQWAGSNEFWYTLKYMTLCLNSFIVIFCLCYSHSVSLLPNSLFLISFHQLFILGATTLPICHTVFTLK